MSMPGNYDGWKQAYPPEYDYREDETEDDLTDEESEETEDDS